MPLVIHVARWAAGHLWSVTPAAILATVAVTLSIGAGTAIAGDNNVTEDQILKVLKEIDGGASIGF